MSNRDAKHMHGRRFESKQERQKARVGRVAGRELFVEPTERAEQKPGPKRGREADGATSVFMFPPSVFFSKHDRDDPFRNARVGRVWRVVREGVVVVVDLEEDRLTVCLKGSEVVFFVRVFGAAEIVIDRDGLDDVSRVRVQSRDPWGYDDEARRQGLTQLVIERANFGRSVRTWCYS